MRVFIAFLICLASWAHGKEIVVSVETTTSLQPVYFAPWSRTETCCLTAAYLQELTAVLQFDFSHNGITHVAPSTESRHALATQESSRHFDPAKWRVLGVLYVFRAIIEGDRLHFRVDSVGQGKDVGSYVIDLTGHLDRDRQHMHRLADTIQNDLFGQKGIATSQILYTLRKKTSAETDWNSTIWVCDYDGANAHPIATDEGYCVTPSFFPVANHQTPDAFLYVSYRQGQPKVYISSLKRGGSKRVLNLRGNQLMPVVSPKSDQIAFICDAGGHPDLFIQPFTVTQGVVGKPRQIFAAQAATQASPTFSPDGKRLAFVSDKDGAPRIYILDVPSANQEASKAPIKLISKRCRENTSPAWSPDGKFIAYSAMTGDTRQIWVYDVLSDTEHPITKGAGHKENPSWASNSRYLVFNSVSGESSELAFVHLDTQAITKIPCGHGEKRFPCWSP